MTQIPATLVKQLRDKTGLGLMECKKALEAAGGDLDKAYDDLRKANVKPKETGIRRATDFGRMGLFIEPGKGAALIELQCETAPVAGNDEFIQLAADMAKQLVTGPGAASPDELLAQKSPSNPAQTLGEQKDWLHRRIREEFRLIRIQRFDGVCGGYTHHAGKTIGVLAEIEGSNADATKDVCMHIAASAPVVVNKEELPTTMVEKEREVLSEAARKEGKPENIIPKMIEGRMRNFYAEKVLVEQPFVKDAAKTVGQYLKESGLKVKRFVRWELGKE